MQPVESHRLFDRLALAVVVALLAIPATYVELAHPSWQQISESINSVADQVLHIRLPGSTSPAHHSDLNTAQSAAPSNTAVSSLATSAASGKTVITTTLVHFRASKSVNSPIIADLNAGTTVRLRDDADATWQGVSYQGKDGYIYRAYLQY